MNVSQKVKNAKSDAKSDAFFFRKSNQVGLLSTQSYLIGSGDFHNRCFALQSPNRIILPGELLIRFRPLTWVYLPDLWNIKVGNFSPEEELDLFCQNKDAIIASWAKQVFTEILNLQIFLEQKIASQNKIKKLFPDSGPPIIIADEIKKLKWHNVKSSTIWELLQDGPDLNSEGNNPDLSNLLNLLAYYLILPEKIEKKTKYKGAKKYIQQIQKELRLSQEVTKTLARELQLTNEKLNSHLIFVDFDYLFFDPLLFSLRSFSCVPNCELQVESSGENLYIKMVSLRPIHPGDTLTIRFMHQVVDNTNVRQDLFYRSCGFRCECQNCTYSSFVDTFAPTSLLPSWLKKKLNENLILYGWCFWCGQKFQHLQKSSPSDHKKQNKKFSVLYCDSCKQVCFCSQSCKQQHFDWGHKEFCLQNGKKIYAFAENKISIRN